MGYYYYFRCQMTKQYNQRLWATVTSYYQKSRQTLHFQRMRVVGRSQKRVKPQSLPNKYRNKSKRAIALPAPKPQSSRVRKQIVQSSCRAASIRATEPGLFRQKESRQCVAILLWAPSWGSSCVSWVSLFVVFVAHVSNGALCAFGCWKVFLPPA